MEKKTIKLKRGRGKRKIKGTVPKLGADRKLLPFVRKISRNVHERPDEIKAGEGGKKFTPNKKSVGG